MNQLLDKLRSSYPENQFVPGEHFRYSPEEQQITYSEDLLNTPEGSWSLLHELGHLINQHTDYGMDNDLIKLELEAWETATVEAKKLGIKIDQDHIEDCLDTYRDWQYKRSKCPSCDIAGVQKNSTEYSCINCTSRWRVPSSAICRVSRRSVKK